MTHWYVKDLGRITGVTVQALHHYDRIGLLTPSLRGENGYRVYSEKDLLTLQKIIALKFFGFGLSQIKGLLTKEAEIREDLKIQSHLLEKKANGLLEASQALKSIIADCERDKSIPWETIIKLIEVYNMTQNAELEWVKKILTPEELKEFAAFDSSLKTRFTEEQKKAWEQKWAALVIEVEANLGKDPTSSLGIALGKDCMDLINELYGPKYASLRTALWEKGFKKGHSAMISPKVVSWLDKAVEAYYRGRIYALLEQAGPHAPSTLRAEWNALMEEIYGIDNAKKQEFITATIADVRVSEAAKKWLKA